VSRDRLHGIPASPGVAVGPAVVVDRFRLKARKRRLEDHEITAEVGRFRAAVAKSLEQLEEITKQLETDAKVGISIIDAHKHMLADDALVGVTVRLVSTEAVNSEWALMTTATKIREMFEGLDDPYFRERQSDGQFVCERILRNLTGQAAPALTAVEPDSIVVAHDLSPAETAQMLGQPVAGFATAVGSRTSHTAIMARSLEIPAVVGLGEVADSIVEGDIVAVDGTNGVLVVDPDADELALLMTQGADWVRREQSLRSTRDLPAQTADGERIELLANIEFPGEAAVALEHGADGIGLYRTEFLFVNRDGLPSEDEQYAVYRSVVTTVAPRPVTLRTFDVGGDKFVTSFPLPRELNPALGLRGIRLCLRLPEVFKTQLRAMLRASREGNLLLMFPMISGVAELRSAWQILEEARSELAEREGFETPLPKIGCMIEVPSAVMTADLLAREVDFFSIGTNDLIQYTLAIDRASEHMAHMYHPLHPAVLRSIRQVVQAADEAGVPVATCGAMADEPLYALALIGLGIHTLSTTPLSLPHVKRAIRHGRAEQGRQLVREALELSTAEEVEALVQDSMRDLLGELAKEIE